MRVTCQDCYQYFDSVQPLFCSCHLRLVVVGQDIPTALGLIESTRRCRRHQFNPNKEIKYTHIQQVGTFILLLMGERARYLVARMPRLITRTPRGGVAVAVPRALEGEKRECGSLWGQDGCLIYQASGRKQSTPHIIRRRQQPASCPTSPRS